MRRGFLLPFLCLLCAPAVAAGQSSSYTTEQVGVLNNGGTGGNFWFLGVTNPTLPSGDTGENDGVLAALEKYQPWRDAPADRKRTRDNWSGASILEDLKFFHDNVKPGDVFLFWYGGHTVGFPDNDPGDPNDPDEPAAPDPLPPSPGLTREEQLKMFADDEAIGRPRTGGETDRQAWATDDELASDPYLGSFPDSSTVIVIFNTCAAGGFLGGSSDLDRPAIAAKRNMLFIAPVAEGVILQEGIGCPRLHHVFETALDAAAADGTARPSELLSEMSKGWKNRSGRDLVSWNNLDEAHDRVMAQCTPTTEDGAGAEVNGFPACPSVVPEPMSVALLGTGLAGVAGVARWRRRRTGGQP